jgi:putative redox protein
MKITLNRINDAYHFQAKNERGHKIELDSRAEFGGSDLAASPMELLLVALAGCNAIDIISILKKQRQEVTSYKTECYVDPGENAPNVWQGMAFAL